MIFGLINSTRDLFLTEIVGGLIILKKIGELEKELWGLTDQ